MLEFPQSGERFEGVANFKEWRSRSDGRPWQYGVQLTELRDGKVARERIYVTKGWEGTRVAGSVALGHTRGHAGVSVPRPGLDHGSSLL